MKLLAALDGIIVPESTDDYRLMLLYYSGDLSRGDVHIRAVIDDVIPSVASKVQQILKRLNRSELFSIRELFGLDRDENKEDVRLSSLPAMLANAYIRGTFGVVCNLYFIDNRFEWSAFVRWLLES